MDIYSRKKYIFQLHPKLFEGEHGSPDVLDSLRLWRLASCLRSPRASCHTGRYKGELNKHLIQCEGEVPADNLI